MPDTIEPPAPDSPTERPNASKAWHKITHALGHDLQAGMARADRARRRMAGGF